MKTGVESADLRVQNSRSRAGEGSLTVLIVVEPGLDGVFRHVEGLLHFLLAQGTKIHLAYSSRRSGAAMLALVEEVRLRGGEVMDLRVSNIPQPADIAAVFRLAAMIRRLKPDVVHAHSSKSGLFPGLSRVSFAVPSISTRRTLIMGWRSRLGYGCVFSTSSSACWDASDTRLQFRRMRRISP